MAPSLRSISVAALAVIGQASAVWELQDTYDSTNFFDEFNFFDDPDPTHGLVKYRNKDDAQLLNLAVIEDGDVVIRPDAHSVLLPGVGRDSVRLESKKLFTHGLFIARFTHLPAPVCGSWPAFWAYGDPWVQVGEVDIYEQWNDRTYNQPALHTYLETEVGACKLVPGDMVSTVLTSNCDNSFTDGVTQFQNQGCSVRENTGPYGLATGGVYAMEWTSDHIYLWSFKNEDAPADISSAHPDPTTWGPPSVALRNSNCDIDDHFANHKLVLNIAFCGDAAGLPVFWDESCINKAPSCVEYVAENPTAFEEAYFKVKDIRVFQEEDDSSSSTTTTTTTDSSTTTDTSTTTDSTTTSTTDTSTTSNTDSTTATDPSTTSTSTTASTTSTTSSTTNPGSIGNNNPSGSLLPSTTHCKGPYCPRPTNYRFSTVYTTRVHTITACPPHVKDCPNRHLVVTETLPLYTTICPADETDVPVPEPPKTRGRTTLTKYETSVYTVTSCPDANCHKYVTTEVRATTYCPDDERKVHTVTKHLTTSPVTVTIPRPTANHVCKGDECDKPVVPSVGPVQVSGGSRIGVSIAAFLGLAAVAVLI